MRITDNPALTASTLSSSDVILLTDVDDLTNGKPKDKKLTFNELLVWVVKRASISFNAYTGGARTLENLVSTNPITSNTIDLNDLTAPGRYALVSGEEKTYTNYPNGAVNGWLDVYVYGATIKQYFHRLGSKPTTFKDEYFRIYASGSWTDWEKIINQTSLDSALSSYVPTSRTVNGHALSGNVTVTASDLGLANAVVSRTCTEPTPESGANAVVGNTGSLSAGTYIILGGGWWASNANGSRSVHLTTNSDGSAAIAQAHVTSATANGQLFMQVVHLVSLTSATTFYLAAWQNSGEALKFTSSYLKYIKLHS